MTLRVEPTLIPENVHAAVAISRTGTTAQLARNDLDYQPFLGWPVSRPEGSGP